ncbi:DMT family transporter [Enemella sp. A6]|uniref:DMT family transporter n=1 Tax=Enemella sp. A6 TaxID=3440152 RepID=UPI003EB89B9B
MTHPANHQPSSAGTLIGVLASLFAGSMVSVQSRVNGELAERLGDPYAAAVVSFGTGLTLCIIGVLVFPAGRRGVRSLPGLVRRRAVPWWHLLAGLFGAYLVAVQTQVTVPLGVSLFILSIVVGQSVGGLLVDRLGIGPGGPKPLSLYRLAGTAMIIAAVFVAMLPRITVGSGGGGAAPLTLLGLALFPVLAGVLSTVQTAWNASVAAASGTPFASTLTNFVGGTSALVIALLVSRSLRDPGPWQWPTQWWLYIGGAAGIVFIALAAALARRIGVLQTSLGMVTGMLLCALLLDVLAPTPTTLITPITVLGTLGTLVGLVVVTLPWRSAPQFLRSSR